MKLSNWPEDTPGESSWSSKLYTILRPAPRPPSAKFGRSCSRFRHSPGDIWRHTLAVSVYHDLAGNALTHRARKAMLWRRFVRVEHLGLSGVVFYEIPIPPSSSAGGSVSTGENLKRNSARGALALRYRSPLPVAHRLTLTSVFGDLDDEDDAGMDLDDLMDEIDAKVVYFPAYACTSFIVGQVMTAFLHDLPARRPVPAHEGFSVCLGEEHVRYPSAPIASDNKESTFSPEKTPTPSSICRVQDVICLSALDMHETLSLPPDDPYVTLCVRSSVAFNPPAQDGFLGSLFPDSRRVNDEMDDLGGDGDDEGGFSSGEGSVIDESVASESNIATDGQSSMRPIAKNSSDEALIDPRLLSQLITDALSLECFSGTVDSSKYATHISTPRKAQISDSNNISHATGADFVCLPKSISATAPNIPVYQSGAQKHNRTGFRSSHSLSTRIPCLARARKLPQSFYVYKDYMSSESFMDLSGGD